MTKTLKIEVPAVQTRTWKTLEELPFTLEEIVTIVHRYCDAQDHAKNYRTRKAVEFKELKERVKAMEESSK